MQMPNFACVSQINGPLASLAQFKLRQLKIMDLKYLDFLPLYLQIIQNILNWYFGLSMDIMFTYCVLLASNGTCAWCILCSTFKRGAWNIVWLDFSFWSHLKLTKAKFLFSLQQFKFIIVKNVKHQIPRSIFLKTLILSVLSSLVHSCNVFTVILIELKAK